MANSADLIWQLHILEFGACLVGVTIISQYTYEHLNRTTKRVLVSNGILIENDFYKFRMPPHYLFFCAAF